MRFDLPILLISVFSYCAYGQFELFLISGSRAQAFGGTYFSLSDDNASVFYNPAILGFPNSRWNGGAINYSVSSAPSFSNHSFISLNYQNENLKRFGFSAYLNSAELNPGGFHALFSFCSGFNFFSTNNFRSSIGLGIKGYSNSLLNSSTILFDLGYLGFLDNGIRFGFSAQNIGPEVSNKTTDTTWVKIKLPNALILGLGHSGSVTKNGRNLIGISSELTFKYFHGKITSPFPEAFYADPVYEFSRFILQTGIDFLFCNTISAIFGVCYQGEMELYNSFGLGLFLFNHFDLNGYCGFNYFQNTYRYGISFTLLRLTHWCKADLRWWLSQ